jgi:hypothetical protein
MKTAALVTGTIWVIFATFVIAGASLDVQRFLD